MLFLLSLFALLQGCRIQRSILYQTGDISVTDVKRYAAGTGLRLWPDESPDYRGLISLNEREFEGGTIVVFHGNAGPAVFRDYYVKPLENRGYRVILAEYPGYGGRPGDLTEESLVADAVCTVLEAEKMFGSPCILWGESMGCGIAAALSKDSALSPRGLVLITPWDTLKGVAKARLPILPARIFIQDMYDNITNLKEYDGPVAVVMAGKDRIIPNKLTLNLYNSLSCPKQIWVFDDTGHNNWPTDQNLTWWDEVLDFIESAATAKK
jgi:pimeloyl-ACP methyl ester carboxylesterase